MYAVDPKETMQRRVTTLKPNFKFLDKENEVQINLHLYIQQLAGNLTLYKVFK